MPTVGFYTSIPPSCLETCGRRHARPAEAAHGYTARANRHEKKWRLRLPQYTGGDTRADRSQNGARTLAQESALESAQAMPEEGNGKKTSWLSPDNPSHKWWVTPILMLGILTQGLNFDALNVALPSMVTNLRADVETIQWVVTAFMVTRTVVMPTIS